MRALSPAERMKGEACSTEQEIEVLAPNWWGVNVYMRCQQTLLSGMSGGVFLGVSAQEVRAAASMLRVPAREWPDVIDTAQALAGMVAKIENDRAESRARAARSRAAKG